MKVYIVMGGFDYGEKYVLEVFSSKDSAKDYISKAYADCDPEVRSRPLGYDDLWVKENEVKNSLT